MALEPQEECDPVEYASVEFKDYVFTCRSPVFRSNHVWKYPGGPKREEDIAKTHTVTVLQPASFSLLRLPRSEVLQVHNGATLRKTEET